MLFLKPNPREAMDFFYRGTENKFDGPNIFAHLLRRTRNIHILKYKANKKLTSSLLKRL